ncbi:dnaJ, partial [Symbiodinium sp. CCMP2592]
GEDLASTGSSKSTGTDETKDKAEKTKGEENTEESDSDEESQGAEEDPSDSMSSVEMEGFSTNMGPHHKAKPARSAGHPTDRHNAPHSKVESRHQESPVKATAKHTSGKHSADKEQPEKHEVKAKTKAEIKSHSTHKMQRKKDSASLQEADTTQTTTYYFTLVASNKYCANANSGYKTNVGNYQTKACFEYVLNEASCGKFFDFGVVDGACDCVPKVETNCNQADADNYHVYLIQKGGPRWMIRAEQLRRSLAILLIMVILRMTECERVQMPLPAEQDHYSILGLKARASQTEVKKAYRSLCKRYHPDKAVHLDEATRREREAQMVKLNVAYQVLNSPKQRFDYDLAQPCPEEKRAADPHPEGEVPFAAGFRASTPNQRSSMGSANPGTRFRYPYSAKYTQRSRQARRMDPSQYTTHVDGRAAEFTGRRAVARA